MKTRTSNRSRKTPTKSKKKKTATPNLAKPAKKTASAKGNATPARIVHKPAHEHAASRQGHMPGQLIVRCKTDVADGLPDVMSASIASLPAFALPTAIESPFKKLAD